MFSSFCVGTGVSGRGRRARTISNFLTRDLVTLNNTLPISHNPYPLAAGPTRNAETWNLA